MKIVAISTQTIVEYYRAVSSRFQTITTERLVETI